MCRPQPAVHRQPRLHAGLAVAHARHKTSESTLTLLRLLFPASFPLPPPPHTHTAKSYHAFLASEAVIKQIPRLLGPGLNKAGKFPSPISGGKTVEDMVSAVLWLSGCVGCWEGPGHLAGLLCLQVGCCWDLTAVALSTPPLHVSVK
jgi:hypothetical protein